MENYRELQSYKLTYCAFWFNLCPFLLALSSFFIPSSNPLVSSSSCVFVGLWLLLRFAQPAELKKRSRQTWPVTVVSSQL